MSQKDRVIPISSSLPENVESRSRRTVIWRSIEVRPMLMTGKFECKNDIVAHDYTKECIRKASLLKNPPLPPFTEVSRKLSGFGKGLDRLATRSIGGILLNHIPRSLCCGDLM
jgi:hypothetical protein